MHHRVPWPHRFGNNRDGDRRNRRARADPPRRAISTPMEEDSDKAKKHDGATNDRKNDGERIDAAASVRGSNIGRANPDFELSGGIGI